METKKTQIENLQKETTNLKNQVSDLTNKNIQLAKDYAKVLNVMDGVMVENKQLNQTVNSQMLRNPYLQLNLNGQPYLNAEQINANFSIAVKQKMSGMYANLQSVAKNGYSNDGSDGMSVFYTYLFILERAKYFMSCVQFDSQLDDVVKVLYLAMYYGSLNGSIGFTMDANGCYLFYINEKKIDKYGKIERVKGVTFNYYNTVDFKEEKVDLPGNQVAIFKFNNEEFGLWVLAWNYLNNLYGFLIILLNQTDLLNKRFVLRTDTKNPNLRTEISAMLKSPGILMWLNNEVDLKQLETPDFDINQIWQLIENYTNYFDFHFLNMRVKDMDASDKERDIASQQANHSTLNENKNQFVDYFIDDFIHQINAKFNTDIQYKNRMINMDDGIHDQTKTLNKLKGGDENEQHNN